MGVMLSLDRERPAKGRRRQGQHVRDPRDAERGRPLRAVRRYDAPAAGRPLARLARAVLARKDPQIAGTRAAAGAARSRPRQAGPHGLVRPGSAPGESVRCESPGEAVRGGSAPAA